MHSCHESFLLTRRVHDSTRLVRAVFHCLNCKHFVMCDTHNTVKAIYILCVCSYIQHDSVCGWGYVDKLCINVLPFYTGETQLYISVCASDWDNKSRNSNVELKWKTKHLHDTPKSYRKSQDIVMCTVCVCLVDKRSHVCGCAPAISYLIKLKRYVCMKMKNVWLKHWLVDFVNNLIISV